MTQDRNELLALQQRIGAELLAKRLRQQENLSATLFGEGLARLHWLNLRALPRVLKTILAGLGLLERGLQNSLDFQVVEVVTGFAELPEAFDGFRILHLSDLHIDGMLDQGKALATILDQLDYDLCVMTGDFRFRNRLDYNATHERMAQLLEHIICTHGCYGVLGNHDFIEQVPGFERLGLRMLLNESVRIDRAGESLYLAGIDDPHFYGTHDLEKACSTLPDAAFSILLSHTPEVVEAAALAKIDFYLCGHTHGGQICLPGGLPLLTYCRSSRQYSRGSWQHAGVRGYTSSGTGSSCLQVRYCCPPEITLHRLRRVSSETMSG